MTVHALWHGSTLYLWSDEVSPTGGSALGEGGTGLLHRNGQAEGFAGHDDPQAQASQGGDVVVQVGGSDAAVEVTPGGPAENGTAETSNGENSNGENTNGEIGNGEIGSGENATGGSGVEVATPHTAGGNADGEVVPPADEAAGRQGVLPESPEVARLRAVVGEMTGDGLLASTVRAEDIVLWLPHDETGVLARGDEAGGAVHLAPVRVAALAFVGGQVADLLMPLSEDVPDMAGESLTYFARLHRWVLCKIGAKQFYPDLDQPRAGTYVGVWRLLTGVEEGMGGGAEVEQLGKFALAMPGVARALVLDEVPEPGRIVEQFVAVAADAFIRRAVSTDAFFTRVHGLAQQPAAAGDVRWLSALLGTDDVLRGGNTESNAFLAELVRGWVRKLDTGRASDPWRLVLSLREPALPEDFDEEADATDGGDLTWRLVLQLRAPAAPGEDVGALFDAEQLWDEAADAAGVFGRGLAERKAQLTADLARAAEVCPALAELMKSDAPAEMTLSTGDANTFIRVWSVALRGAGFVVELPEWADRRERGLGLMLSVRPTEDDEDALLAGMGGDGIGGGMGRGRRGLEGEDGLAEEIPSGHFGLESLLEFDWQIAVGDLRLSPAEFKALSQRGSPLVRYKGQWLQIDPDAGQKATSFLSSGGKGKMTLAQALRTAYGVAPADTGLPVIGLSGRGWIDQLLSQSPSLKVTGVEQPKSFTGTLRPYQLRGLDWMLFLDRLGLGGCLADDMGLGKTVQLISLLLAEREKAKEKGEGKVGPTLLFAPTSVVGNWLKELTRFATELKVLVHHGPERLAGEDFERAASGMDVVITSYALAHRDVEDLKRPRWHRIAVDEAQKIKNPSAAATVAIRSINAPRRIALTGTPIENHLSELWSIMELLNPGLLGSAADFRERFAVPVEKLGDKAKAQMLRRMIQPFVLRRTKTDPAVAGDLPEKMEMKVYCNLTAEQAAMYERVTAEMLGQIDTATGIRRRGLILAALTRLKQICDHPMLVEGENPVNPSPLPADRRSGKCERILEMLEEVVQAGDAALVFTQYREMGHLLEKLITERLKVNVQFLHGGTTARQRDAMIDRFQDPNGGVKIFILSLRAGGLGLNLTAANHVFHFDRWWNPAVEQQATDRAHRIGQTRKVQVHQFVCVGTLEERIDKLLQDKLMLADQVVGSGDEWLTNLSTEQLRQYLSLGRDAVGDF